MNVLKKEEITLWPAQMDVPSLNFSVNGPKLSLISNYLDDKSYKSFFSASRKKATYNNYNYYRSFFSANEIIVLSSWKKNRYRYREQPSGVDVKPYTNWSTSRIHTSYCIRNVLSFAWLYYMGTVSSNLFLQSKQRRKNTCIHNQEVESGKKGNGEQTNDICENPEWI